MSKTTVDVTKNDSTKDQDKPNPATLAQMKTLFGQLAAGSADADTAEDEVDEDTDGDEDTEDEDEEELPDDKKTPEQLVAELTKLRRAQRKANREAEKYRRLATGKAGSDKDTAGGAGAGKSKTKTTPTGKNGDTEDDEDGAVAEEVLEEIRRSAAAETESKFRPLVIRQAATSALTEAGLVLPDDAKARQAKLNKVIKLLDTDGMEIDDNGEVDGIDDAVEELKEAFPEFFARPKIKTANIDAAPKRKSAAKEKSVTEQQAAAFFGVDS